MRLRREGGWDKAEVFKMRKYGCRERCNLLSPLKANKSKISRQRRLWSLFLELGK